MKARDETKASAPHRLATAALCVGAAAAIAGCGGGDASLTPAMDPKNFIVRLKSVDALPLVQAQGAKVIEQLGQRPIYLIAPSERVTAEELIKELSNSNDVVFLERNIEVYAPEWIKSSVLLGRIGNTVSAIGEADAGVAAWLASAWIDGWLGAARTAPPATVSDATGPIVAVLDTGVGPHDDFRGRLMSGRDLVDGDLDASEPPGDRSTRSARGHGTHVAGIVSRVAPNARILPVRVLGADGAGTLWSVSQGAHFALSHRADVLNMSFGTETRAGDGKRMLETLVQIATCAAVVHVVGFEEDGDRCADVNRGAFVVAGEGNNPDVDPLMPASLNMDGLLPVTASDASSHRAFFASYGAAGELAAPGDLVASTYPADGAKPGGWRAVMSGTSMAVPWVAGTVALVLESTPPAGGWNVMNVAKRIREKARPLSCGEFGGGLREVFPAGAIDPTLPTPCRAAIAPGG